MRLALFSDVHANMPALEAVLPEVASSNADARYALGDLVGYAPWLNEVLERLPAEDIESVLGNYDDGTSFQRDECPGVLGPLRHRDRQGGDPSRRLRRRASGLRDPRERPAGCLCRAGP
jgi:predicted phosphodiesterase